ncbi:LacI family DNA-binding transcriptional regulator [Actinomyces oricola]
MDVARIAEVSHQTVPRVLNVPDSVRPATRARVQAAIEELGYRRNRRRGPSRGRLDAHNRSGDHRLPLLRAGLDDGDH